MSEEAEKKPVFSPKDYCCYCSCKLDNFNRTVEHLYPKSKGYVLSNENKAYACSDCNHLKKKMTPEEFLAAMKMMRHQTVRTFSRDVAKYTRIINNVVKIIQNSNVQRKPPQQGGA